MSATGLYELEARSSQEAFKALQKSSASDIMANNIVLKSGRLESWSEPLSIKDPNARLGMEVSITANCQPEKRSPFADIASKFTRNASSLHNRRQQKEEKVKPVQSPSLNQERPSTKRQKNYTIVKSAQGLEDDESWSDGESNEHEGQHTYDDDHVSSLPSRSEALSLESLHINDQIFKARQMSLQPIQPLRIVKQRSQTSTPVKYAQDRSISAPHDTTSSPAQPIQPSISKDSIRSGRISRKPVSTAQVTLNDVLNYESFTRSGSPVTPAYSPPYGQPKSRFSWTTYADSAMDMDVAGEGELFMPEETAERPLPKSHFSWSTNNTTPTPLTQNFDLGSPSPVPSPLAQSFTSARSPLMPVHRQLASTRNDHTGRVAGQSNVISKLKIATEFERHNRDAEPLSASTLEKALPQPPGLTGADTIESLTLQRDALSVQHSNLEKVLSTLKKKDQASPLEVDEKTRRANRKRMEGFQEKLEEVQREEHTIGMALARAVRRAEKAEGETNNGLWLRRVTG